MQKAKLRIDVEAPNQSFLSKKLGLLKGLTRLLDIATDLLTSFRYIKIEYSDHSFVLEGLSAMILRDSILAYNDAADIFKSLTEELKSSGEEESKL